MPPFLKCDAYAGAGNPGKVTTGGSLLVVDDDPSVRHALWITFRDFYQVTLAENGNKALEIFEKNPADVALIDIRMPGISGLELLQKLKELDPDLEVILLTAYESVEYVREALRLGAFDYLSKPFQVEQLRAAVTSAFQRRASSKKVSDYDQKLTELQNLVQQQQMREELARTRNEIYASILHDINGPLTVIAGYVELIGYMLERRAVLDEDQVSTLRNHTSNISRQVANCIQVSRRYLGFLEGKTTSIAEAGVKEVFYDVAELLKAHPKARDNELLITPPADDLTVAINRTDLLQVLMNLTINALQASPEHHRVEVYARAVQEGLAKPLQSGRFTTHLSSPQFPENSALVALSVQDNGPGIPEDLREKIFEPYFTTKGAIQGSGLGLAIVKRLVMQAHGAIHLYSPPGEGAVFTVYLPLKSAIR